MLILIWKLSYSLSSKKAQLCFSFCGNFKRPQQDIGMLESKSFFFCHSTTVHQEWRERLATKNTRAGYGKSCSNAFRVAFLSPSFKECRVCRGAQTWCGLSRWHSEAVTWENKKEEVLRVWKTCFVLSSVLSSLRLYLQRQFRCTRQQARGEEPAITTFEWLSYERFNYSILYSLLLR